MSKPKRGRPSRSEKLKIVYLHESTHDRWLSLKEKSLGGNGKSNNDFANQLLNLLERVLDKHNDVDEENPIKKDDVYPTPAPGPASGLRRRADHIVQSTPLLETKRFRGARERRNIIPFDDGDQSSIENRYVGLNKFMILFILDVAISTGPVNVVRKAIYIYVILPKPKP